jgi:hypothetical protein
MERKKFIRLHRTSDNSSLLLSGDDILYVDAGANGRKDARITLKDPRVAPFYVNESPDKIYRMLEEE